MTIDLWRYQVGDRWYYVTRDPAAIKRPGEKLIVFTHDEFREFVRSMTKDPAPSRFPWEYA